MSEFTKLLQKLRREQHSSWLEWAEQKQNERMLWLSQNTVPINPESKDMQLERFSMSEDERHAAQVLEKCRYLPGSFEKRFARNLSFLSYQEKPQITHRQRVWLWKQVYRYRRQIKDKELVNKAKELVP